MNKLNLLLRSVGVAFLMGSVLALYLSLSTFWRMPYAWWLALNNLLVVTSLILTTLVGYKHRRFEISFKFMLMTVALFFSVMMLLFIGSYVVTTAFFVDRMVWIPFFYYDYNHHGFESVRDYLNHKNNFRELLELQVVSFLISSVMYFMAGILGYGVRAVIDGTKKPAARAQSTF